MRKMICGALAFAAAIVMSAAAQAQMPQMPKLPLDSATISGKLDNGITYYIRHNEKPKGQADFFIAQKVGSVLEEDNQRGLAHFLEHMCFNGTQSFPGNSLVSWLETVGVKFGRNLNAYTGFDETVYNISSVPVQRQGVVDSCLIILHDWADGLTLDPEEINKERGVIHQEWRRSSVGQQRILERLLPVVYGNSRYGHRLPIGTMEVVDNFEPKALRDYYEKWYRPDNQAIIVVGDIDPNYVLAKIKELFGPIKNDGGNTPRPDVAVEDNPGTIYAIGADPEQKLAIALFMFKFPQSLIPKELKNTQMHMMMSYAESMITTMLNERLSDMAKKPDCPFAQASVDLGNFFVSPTKDALSLKVVGKGNDLRPALQAAYREVLRAVRGGFTVSEYDRAKAEYMARMERAYEQRSARENTSYAREYAAHFTKQEPAPGIAAELEMAKMLTQAFPLEQLNAAIKEFVGPDNRVLLAMLPETAEYHQPTEAELSEVITAVEAENIEPFKENVKTEPLIAKLPKAQLPKVTTNKVWNATELVYKNGVHVILNPTKLKEGEILFTAVAKGGLAALDNDPASVRFLPYGTMHNGLGTYNSSDLEKYLNGKNTSLSISMDDYMRALQGSTNAKNLPTLMELIYMTFKDYTISADEFAAMQNMIEAALANQVKNPEYIFGKNVAKSLYKAAAKQALSVEDVKSAKLDETLQTVKTLFNNPADFTFVFTGDFDAKTLEALCNQYIGTLPASRMAGVPYKANPDYEMATGAADTHETAVMKTPQTQAAITVSANVPYSAKNRAIASMAGQILSNRLIHKIREEMGAVYSISAGAQLSRLGNQNFELEIPFPMDPAKKAEVLSEIRKMVDGMAENITADEFSPIKEYMVKTAKEELGKNSPLHSAITGYALNGVDIFNGKEAMLNTITPADIQAFMKQVLSQGNYRVYILDPAE